ncbi:MAG: Transcription initiation factor TFIID subunit 12 [Thelocarpon impressellum]|nr:MAG: Transcription initiation factor TFIID subunit 12 [Thelocarpon impressellum]
MNNANAPRPQGAPGQVQLIRPEMVRSLPHLEPQQKAQYESGIRSLYASIQNSPADSAEHQQAQARLLEITNNIRNSLTRWKHQQQQQAQQAQQGQQGQQGQPLPQQQPQQAGVAPAQQGNHPSAGQAAGMRPQAAGPQGQPAQAGAQQQVAWPSGIAGHVQAFPFTLPPTIPAGSPESEKWLAEAKQRYGDALHKQEQAKGRILAMQGSLNSRQQAGKPLTDQEKIEFNQRKTGFARVHAEQKRFLESFRQQQADYKTQAQAGQTGGAGGQAAAAAAAVQTGNPPAANAASRGPQQAAAAAQRPPQPPQAPGPGPGPGPGQASMTQQNASAPGQQKSQTPQNPPNPAVDAARAQAAAAARGSASPSTGGQAASGHGQAGATSQATPHSQAAPSQRPQAETFTQAQAAAPAAAGSPQTTQPQSATTAGPPHPLSHEDAIARAARTHFGRLPTSNPTSPRYPGAAGATNPTPTPREINTTKMPIPKNLNITPLQQVSLGAARPSYTGGASGGNAMMGQPAVQKMPGYVLEGEGERVLSKKKLDELVRQVTGGGEGEGLTAEVEEAVLQVADDFVDQVITSACKLAKLRQSATLDIRDIQLILERNYNIRVPGYASDEIRTVRKFAPAQGWSQKMSAVQAAKISGGKAEL